MDGRVPIQGVFGDRVPTFQLQTSTAVNQADQTGTVTDVPPSSNSYELLHVRTTAANQADSEKFALYSSLSLEIDYESLTAEHTKFRRLRMSSFFYAVGESLLDDDK